ncbi:hypothetical protein EW145_g4329 [Phellinidium pouzarii]|uniref:Midasin n=1 Tax=Phellinidium pouzarii TaxID=167371 RepID=A0A4V3XCM1_9AGAM|nr:hypothetical protein EW145_g4329 [Phellinidium pouzarii]
MDTPWDIPNPLSLNIHRQLNLLLELIPQDSPFFDELQISSSGGGFLPNLSRYMLHPSLTLAIAWAFRPLLMDLCARWLDEDGDIVDKLEALALLIEVHEELYPIFSAFLRQSSLEGGPLCKTLGQSPVDQPDVPTLHRILLAYYRVLRATPSLSKSLNWDFSLLLKLCTTPYSDRGVRWLAIRCYVLQSNMSDRKREEMERSILGESGLEDCSVNYGEDASGAAQKVDGWMLPVLEVHRIQEYRARILTSPDFVYLDEASDTALTDRDLSPRIVNAHGILLLRTPTAEPPSSTLVLTASALISLRKIAVNISLRRPTLLTSSPSSGKTAFLNHLSKLLHPSKVNQIITIHLADTSLDPRSLLGSYVSSSTHAGSFEWKDGVLVKAMREGNWIVLKDIDRASSEVLGILGPLVESMDDSRPIGCSAMITVANRGVVEATESFALFASRSVEGIDTSAFPSPSFLGAQKWREVVVLENTPDDLRLIVNSKFPNIAGPVSDCLINIWKSVKRLRSLSSTRSVGLRDLEKFCNRASHLLESNHAIPSGVLFKTETPISVIELLPYPTIREEMYLEARDVFFAAGATNKSSIQQRDAISKMIGEKLGLTEETCNWVLKRRTPIFEIIKDIDGRPTAIKAGRTILAVDALNNLSDSLPARSFSVHKQAIRLISQLAACVAAVEPVLLTGETGTGKTSIISHLASLLNRPLISLNMSNQSESSDLVGGFRPVSARVPALELQQCFTDLFQKTFSSKKNEVFHRSLRKAVADGKWKTAVKLWREVSKMALNKLKERDTEIQALPQSVVDTSLPRKRQKLQSGKAKSTESEWLAFEADVHHFEVQHVLDKGKFAFHYVEGPLVKAIRTGAWVLLDEVNLASPETLECISGLLQGPDSSVTLTEQGSLEPVPRHRNFRLFACMNPATDVGKKDLPSNIRARFTEIDVPSPDAEQETLLNIITHYIGHLTVTDKAAIFDVAQFYTSVKRLSESGKIADGSDHRPHYSMRTLSRALTFAADTVQMFGLRRGLWEGFTMTFTMVLDQASSEIVLDLARRTLLSGVKNTVHFLSHNPLLPQDNSAEFAVQLGPFWLSSGPNEREEAPDYILTPSVQKKLVDLARIVMTKRYPILIEGPTSSGKTSSIEYLARRTGHNFVRINNHEHTDIQEYLGSYSSDPKTGKLVFRDGLLVRALRRGDWIVLDELNLAPTDVLEALNRLLDDNRELVIPETQEVVKPHLHFVLFATQNPSGVYAGRKVLSRALRNRFLEVHFDDVPPTELEHILCQRSRIAPSHSQRIVAVFHELQKRRQIGRIFEGKEGFATLRDLFRWANRDARGYQELAENGYMLLAERTRHEEDKAVVKEVIENVMNVSISVDTLYDISSLDSVLKSSVGIVWTKPMQRLFTLLSRALHENEPVLLVGETGSGKTSVCQIYAEIERQTLRTVNCHQNTEASDIIGSLRPVRREASLETDIVREAVEILKLGERFDSMDKDQVVSAISNHISTKISTSERETLITAQQSLLSNPGLLRWKDGPLVMCMRSADVFLLDEISLADDSVLERLNSVLEPSRTLILAEKGGDNSDEFQIVAEDGFKFVATMNPGGDFGKKELSPALRNRFTEIWVPSIMKREDLQEIIKHSWKYDDLVQLTDPLLDFVDWFLSELKDSSILTLRDVLSWVNFCNNVHSSDISPPMLFIHGGQMAVVDGLSSLTQLSSWSMISLQDLHRRANRRLEELCEEHFENCSLDVTVSECAFRIGPFSVPLGSQPLHNKGSFNFEAPTSLSNAFRLVRACQIIKPILLEGSPGVGKTSLVSALATASGQRLCRINLSEQTDLVDLFGSDLPVDGDAAGHFTWRDAEFLQAMKMGHWVLLDEMNLASQSVLEGLNAVFDHRGSVYVPELDRTFSRHPNFRVFAAQNPLNQGSGRKGLPKSFLNRFTKVFVEQLLASDLLIICVHLFPTIPLPTLQLMIDFICRLHDEIIVKRSFGILGSPWEFNLRDIIRWASLMERPNGDIEDPWKHLNTIFGRRLRCESDRHIMLNIFADVFGDTGITDRLRVRHNLTPEHITCGSSFVHRGDFLDSCRGARLLASKSSDLEAALSSISKTWLLIVTGPQAIGKTSFVRSLASVMAQPLQELSLGSLSDTSDLIGSFEQIDDVNSTQHTPPEASQGPRFGWFDGPLVRAMKKGEWLLLDNANLCSPSVLDRLNSLCEIGGSLVLTEKGLDHDTVKPHPSFRLIMTVDSQRNEISRAMRNRGIEIALGADGIHSDEGSLLDAQRLPLNIAIDRNFPNISRSTFELSRRALFQALTIQPGLQISPCTTDLIYTDSLSSKMNDYKIFDFRYFLRLLKSIKNPYCDGLHEDFSLLFREGTESFLLLQAGSLHCVKSDLEACKLTSILLEAHILATILEDRLQQRKNTLNIDVTDIATVPSGTEMLTRHENVERFLKSIPALVRQILLAGHTKNDLMQCSQITLKLVHYAQCLFRAATQSVTDYSTLYVISGWICDCIMGAPQPIRKLEEHTHALRDDYTLKSGQKIFDVWKAFYCPLPSLEFVTLMQKFGNVIYDTDDRSSQKRIFELISLLSIGNNFDEQQVVDWRRLETEVEGFLNITNNDSDYGQSISQTNTSLASLAIELDGLTNLSENTLGLEMVQGLTFVSDVIPDLVHAHLEWHRAVWKEDEHLQASGPSAFYTPIQLRRKVSNGTLGSMRSLDVQLDDEIRRGLIECSHLSTREELIESYLLQNVIFIFCACCPTTSDEECSDMYEKLALSLGSRSCITSLLTAFQEFKNTEVFSSFELVLFLLEKLESCEGRIERLRALGQCWIALSQTLLSLYVPNLSLDPVEIQRCKNSYCTAQEIWIGSQIHVHSSLQVIKTGDHSNVFTRLLQDHLCNLKSEFGTDSLPNYPSRESGSALLQSFWKETRAFLEDMVSSERINKFVVTADPTNPAFYSQEILIQDSVSNFTQRMRCTYDSLQDLLPAIELALMQLRFGLRTIQHSMFLRTLPIVNSSLSEITCFPSAGARTALATARPDSIAQGEFAIGDALALKLIGFAQNNSRVGMVQDILDDVRTTYQQFLSLWNQDNIKEAEKMRESESLYRSRPIDDADEEAKEVQQLFPTFADEDDALDQDCEKHSTDSPRSLNAGIRQELMRVHLQLFGAGPSPSGGQHDLRSRWNFTRFKMVSSWTDVHLSSMTSDMDERSLAFRIDVLCKLKASFQQNDYESGYSFYHDSNFPEAKKASEVVTSLKRELCKRIRDWPDQLVLRHLRDRCDNVLSMSIRSPVAKILGALERLLLHTEDWEMFANSENSLRSHRQSMTALVIEWRRLELSGWRSILDSEARSFCDDLADWWFRLYDATVRGAIAAGLESTSSSEDALSNYLDSLTPLLEDFITSSPFGQFRERLRLVRSFSSLTSELAGIEDDPFKTALRRSSRILTSIHIFYDQFSLRIDSVLSERRGAIEKDVQSLVQLATWRDINIHALQQSVQRTHKQLYRRIRKFREVLRQPIVDQLRVGSKAAEDDSGTSSADRIVNRGILAGETISSAASIASDAPKVLKKFVLVLSSELDALFNPASYLAIEDLCISIITAQNEYSQSVLPEGLSAADRKRWTASLLNRKRRSWNDLLRELKRIGISPNVKPEILHMLRNRRRVMEQRAFSFTASRSLESVTEKVDLYFYQSTAVLSDLLLCSAKHHPDISTRELRRGIALFESTFSYALSTRTRVIAQIEAWNQVCLSVRRAHALDRSRGTCTDDFTVLGVLQEVKLKAAELCDVLDEVCNVADNVSMLSGIDAPIPETSFYDLQRWKSSCEDMKERLCTLARDVNECAPILVFEDDLDLIQLAIKHFNDACTFLVELGQREPRLGRFCNAISIWHSGRFINGTALQIVVEPINSPCNTKKLTDTLLIVAQELLAVEKSSSDISVPEDDDHVRRQLTQLVSVTTALRIDTVVSHMNEFLSSLQRRSRPSICHALRQTLPFLDQYLFFFERHLIQYASWTKSLFKLAYIYGCLLRNVAQSGFCKPPDQEELNDEEGLAQSAEGTGLGQGAGDENVSKQIEDESQFEGIKGQDDEMGGHQNEDASDEALDVDFDLAGELEDGPDQDSKDDDDDDKAMSDFDDEFGHDVSDELDPVDEDFWNDQKDGNASGVQDINGAEKTAGESETVAKEKEAQPEKENPKLNSDNLEPAKDIDDGPEDAEATEQLEEDTHSKDISPGRDAVDVDAGDSSAEDTAEQAGRREDLAGEDMDEETYDDEELRLNEEQGERASDLSEDGEEHAAEPIEIPQDEAELNDQSDGQGKSNADIHSGTGSNADIKSGMDNMQDTPEKNVQTAGENVAGLPPSVGNESSQVKFAGEPSGAPDRTESVPAENARNAVSCGTETGQISSDSADADLPNPHRSIGDALREVRRRFDEIRNSTESEVAEMVDGTGAKQPISLEYALEDSMDIDMQALGPAMGEEHARLNQLDVLEESEGNQDSVILPQSQPTKQDLLSQSTSVDTSLPSEKENDSKEPMSHGEGENGPNEAMEVDKESPTTAELPGVSVEEEPSLNKEVEVQLNKWRYEGQPEEDGQRVWQLYDSLTQSLSFSLCEQLRLILEPTRATRLMGDFRSGKRLNMKKIIPYIASNYTKDKIWLRRVKPSQREYQVLIALDDSRSMAESHSIHLAFQTLALISKALNRLEVGDLAIASFGESTQLLHGFDDGPFTDQTGTKIVEAFKFQQTATNVHSLLEASVDVLTKARERRTSSSPSDLWQLEIIISDGICQDHEELRAIMRKAEEEHILIVFIVIDDHSDPSLSTEAAHSHNSIINMNQATYKTVNGRLELQMQRYLDSFPFEFFVILKNVEALPDVLADTLRQFFERISTF